jgi:AcrR family transcriptional regulator
MAMGRREERRRETVSEILAAALDCMAEEGVAALNLSEVARRVGMRTPSLYQYFASKLDLYDALFAEAARRCRAATAEAADSLPPGRGQLAAGAEAFVRWCADNPVLAQLLFWRPVPGFEPSVESYAEAEAMLADLRAGLQAAVDARELAPAAASDEGVALHTLLLQGVLSQYLANEPHVPFEKARFPALLPVVLDLFNERYSTKEPR